MTWGYLALIVILASLATAWCWTLLVGAAMADDACPCPACRGKALGCLRGLYGYTTDIYGFASGEESGEWMSVEATNGLRMMNNTATRMQLNGDNLDFFDSASTLRLRLGVDQLHFFDDNGDSRAALDGATGTFRMGSTLSGEPNFLLDAASGDFRLRTGTTTKILLSGSTGDISLVGNVRGGSATALNTGTGYFLGSTGTARFGNPSGNRIRWDGTNLAMTSGKLDIGEGSWAMRIHGAGGASQDERILFDLSGGGFNMNFSGSGAVGFSRVEQFNIQNLTGGQGSRIISLLADSETSSGVDKTAEVGVSTASAGSEAFVSGDKFTISVDSIVINGNTGVTGSCSAVTVREGIVTGCTP